MPQTSILFKLMFMMLWVKRDQLMLPIICTMMHITVKEVLQHFCIMDWENTVYCNIYCSKVKRLTSYAAFHNAVPSAPTPTGQMECFPHLLDLIHIAVWKWAHKKCLERGSPLKKKKNSQRWLKEPSACHFQDKSVRFLHCQMLPSTLTVQGSLLVQDESLDVCHRLMANCKTLSNVSHCRS